MTKEEMDAVLATATDNELITGYTAIKSEVEVLETAHKKLLATRKERMLSIQAAIFTRMNERGIQSIPVKGVGTAFRKQVVKAQANDWSLFHLWAQNKVNAGAPIEEITGLLYKKLNISAIQEVVETTGGPVPGVSLMLEYECVIRRN